MTEAVCISWLTALLFHAESQEAASSLLSDFCFYPCISLTLTSSSFSLCGPVVILGYANNPVCKVPLLCKGACTYIVGIVCVLSFSISGPNHPSKYLLHLHLIQNKQCIFSPPANVSLFSALSKKSSLVLQTFSPKVLYIVLSRP